jgi:hypothetical protein
MNRTFESMTNASSVLEEDGVFESVRQYVLELGYPIVSENEHDKILVLTDEENGLSHLVIDCEGPLIILEQHILDTFQNASLHKRLLQMNRTLVCGAFVLDDTGTGVIFRDTLHFAGLNCAGLERSINALIVALAEYGSELLSFIPAERSKL